jgi:hypothetical protein
MRAGVCTLAILCSCCSVACLPGAILILLRNGLLQICDMVTIARHLNLTLVVPELDKRSFWADPRYSFRIELFQ